MSYQDRYSLLVSRCRVVAVKLARQRRHLERARQRMLNAGMAASLALVIAFTLASPQAWPSSGGGHSATPHSHTHKKGGSQSSKTPTW